MDRSTHLLPLDEDDATVLTQLNFPQMPQMFIYPASHTAPYNIIAITNSEAVAGCLSLSGSLRYIRREGMPGACHIPCCIATR